MTPQDSVTWICQNQGIVTQILSYAWAWMPIASCIAWVTTRYDTLPNWAQAVLQVVAGNFLHAIKEPTK